MFLGDYHALIDFVRSMQMSNLNSAEYVVIAVSESPYDPDPKEKLKYFHKCKSNNFLLAQFDHSTKLGRQTDRQTDRQTEWWQ